MYLCTRNYDLKRGGTFETAKAGTFHSVTAGTSIPLFTLNSINEKCSRVRAAFQSEVDPTLLEQYIITGKSGEVKKVMLSRDMIVWE